MVVKWLHHTVVAHARSTPLEHAGNLRTSASELSRQCASIASARSKSQGSINSTQPESAPWTVTSSISSSSCTNRHAIAGTVLCSLHCHCHLLTTDLARVKQAIPLPSYLPPSYKLQKTWLSADTVSPVRSTSSPLLPVQHPQGGAHQCSSSALHTQCSTPQITPALKNGTSRPPRMSRRAPKPLSYINHKLIHDTLYDTHDRKRIMKEQNQITSSPNHPVSRPL
jgi:hypothetical protein